MSRRQIAWFLGILFVVALLTGGAFSNSDLLEQFRQVMRVYSVIKANYVKPVKSQKLFVGACRGMAQALDDPHTIFLNMEENRRFTDDTEGEFGGLGIEIGIKDGILTVMSPIPGTPAYDAGILAGDRIIEIEGDSTEGIYIQDAVKRLRGKIGTKVTITVLHPESRTSTKISITRGRIQPSALLSSLLDKKAGIGYIHVLQFTARLDVEFAEAAKKLQAKGMKALVLDLRMNPGGLLQMAVKLSDMFVDKGVIVSVRGRRPEEKVVYEAQKGGALVGMPMICLIDAGSASASEIVAGCLRDHHRALLVGVRSYGKGSVQKLFPIPPGGALKLTTARYYTPNGKPIMDREGIQPNIVIPMTTDYQIALRLQEREDKIRGHYIPGVSGLIEKVTNGPHGLKPEKKEPEEPKKDENKKDENKKGEAKKDEDNAGGDKKTAKKGAKKRRDRVVDIQLKGAVTILKLEMGTMGIGPAK